MTVLGHLSCPHLARLRFDLPVPCAFGNSRNVGTVEGSISSMIAAQKAVKSKSVGAHVPVKPLEIQTQGS